MQAIDFHTHTHPTVETGVAFQQRWGMAEPARNGTVPELFGIMERAGVARTLIVPWMPAQDIVDEILAERSGGTPSHADRERAEREVVERWIALNQWAVDAVAEHPDRLMCLVGLDPVLMDANTLRREAADKLAQGAIGLKIAPMFLRVPANDEAMNVFYEAAREHGVFVLSQAGADGWMGAPAWGHPEHFEDVLRSFPQVDIQLAHLGWGAEEEVVRLSGRYPNLYVDCSSRLHLFGQPGQWSLEEAATWFRRIGIDRVIFGTNYPMNDPVEYVKVIQAMPLTDEERGKILVENAQGLVDRSAA